MLRNFFRYLIRLDWVLLLSCLGLCSFGLVAIYSLSLAREPDTFWTLKKQFLALGLGLVALLVLMRTNYKVLRHYTPALYLGTLALLSAVLVFGKSIRGTTGWFELGPFNFQPVEFAKISLIVVLARYFSAHTREKLGWRALFESGLLVGLYVILVMLQPDLGSALALLGIWGCLLLVVGLRPRVLLISVLSVILLGVGSYAFMQPYQKERLLTFVDPNRDPLGQGYNVTQARIAIGSGGLLGRGIGYGSQSQLRFLPESQTDFIFSVLGEELGFVGLLVILGFFVAALLRLLRLGRKAEDDFGALLALGAFFLLLIQLTVNVGMNVGILPVTGITLPFVSYGASALLMMLATVGIAESVAVRLVPETTRY